MVLTSVKECHTSNTDYFVVPSISCNAFCSLFNKKFIIIIVTRIVHFQVSMFHFPLRKVLSTNAMPYKTQKTQDTDDTRHNAFNERLTVWIRPTGKWMRNEIYRIWFFFYSLSVIKNCQDFVVQNENAHIARWTEWTRVESSSCRIMDIFTFRSILFCICVCVCFLVLHGWQFICFFFLLL